MSAGVRAFATPAPAGYAGGKGEASMPPRTSTERLLEDLEAARAPQCMLRKARDGQYNDSQSDSAHPLTCLVRDATAAHLGGIVEAAKAGKYDGTREEGDAWMQREGKHLLRGQPDAE
jgi:hypothetical protein